MIAPLALFSYLILSGFLAAEIQQKPSSGVKLSITREPDLSIVMLQYLRLSAAQLLIITTFTPAIAFSVAERSPSLKPHSHKEKILPAAPWSKPALSAQQVAPVFLQQWQQAGRKPGCASIAPVSLGKATGAKPRPANFGSGAWAVAYDKPGLPGRRPDGSFCLDCGRGAFGIAGTSVDASAPQYQGFPYQQRWADGSRASYGLSGGTSLPYLAYLTVANQRCLYNVWSFLGREHLENLLEQLRLVKTTPQASTLTPRQNAT